MVYRVGGSVYGGRGASRQHPNLYTKYTRGRSRGPLTKQLCFYEGAQEHHTVEARDPFRWLICERPLPSHEGDWKWYFSNLPEATSHERLVEFAHRRHEIERYYQDAKDELGLNHYEGRLWHGLHRHLVLVMWAYSWLALRRKRGLKYGVASEVGSKMVLSERPVERDFSPYRLVRLSHCCSQEKIACKAGPGCSGLDAIQT